MTDAPTSDALEKPWEAMPGQAKGAIRDLPPPPPEADDEAKAASGGFAERAEKGVCFIMREGGQGGGGGGKGGVGGLRIVLFSCTLRGVSAYRG